MQNFVYMAAPRDMHVSAGEPPDLPEHLEVGARSSHESIAGLEAMLNPNLELPQIDNDALEVFLKTGMLYMRDIT